MIIARTLFALTAMCLTSASQAATIGFEGEAANAATSNWEFNCNDSGACQGAIVVTNQENNTRLATLQVLVERNTDTQGLAIIVPLGLALDAGIRLNTGDDVRDLPVNVCFPDGCRVVLALSADEFRDLLFRPSLELNYFGYRAERPIAFSIELDGLKSALTAAVPERTDLGSD